MSLSDILYPLSSLKENFSLMYFYLESDGDKLQLRCKLCFIGEL